jgi:hypothetical protein
MPCSRILVPVLAAMAIVGIVRAQPEGAPTPVDAAPQDGKYVIQPGVEPLFGEMLGIGQTLPGGCTLSDGQIERTAVLATYACGGGQVVLQLLHPGIAPRDAVRTQRFAVTVKRGAPPAGLIDAVAERIRAREAAFEWTSVDGDGAQAMHWSVRVGAGVAIAVLVFWALRRVAARRRRPV